MTEGCCPRVKQIQATIVRYNTKSKTSNVNNEVSTTSRCAQAAEESEEFAKRVCHLKCKLEEANANIILLRSWVGETGETIKDAKPKGPKEMVDYLKGLILKLDDFQNQMDALAERGDESMQSLEQLEKQGCYCSLNSPSCEEIKKQLTDIALEKNTLEDIIGQLKVGKTKSGSIPPQQLVEDIQSDISEVKGCVDWTCPKYENSSAVPTSIIETGTQNDMCTPKRPKLSQTDANPKWNQGTNPLYEGSKCCKSMNTSMV